MEWTGEERNGRNWSGAEGKEWERFFSHTIFSGIQHGTVKEWQARDWSG